MGPSNYWASSAASRGNPFAVKFMSGIVGLTFLLGLTFLPVLLQDLRFGFRQPRADRTDWVL